MRFLDEKTWCNGFNCNFAYAVITNVPLQVFDMNKSGALLSVVMGEKEGTHVTN